MTRKMDVRVASNGLARQYLEMKFPEITFLDLPDQIVRYSSLGASLGLIKRAFAQKRINKEQNSWMKDRFKMEPYDLIISDNVYGVHHPDAINILISHQLSPPSPILKSSVADEIASWINVFDEVWVPDIGENGISGKMLDNPGVKIPIRYLGNTSRFEKYQTKKTIDVLGIISGPEPQSTIFQNALFEIFSRLNVKTAIATTSGNLPVSNEIDLIPLDESQNLNDLALKSDLIVCRSGYTGLLDILKIGAHVLVVPTPGQPEQEYLAKRVERLGLMHSISQKELFKHNLPNLSARQIDEKWACSKMKTEIDSFLRSKKLFEA